MPRLRFKNFCDLEFIQGIDKPRHFRPLLEPYGEYFARQGIDVTRLRNGDSMDRQLLQVFTNPDEDLPADLLDTLYMLDDLADETGHDRILQEARDQRIELNGNDTTPGELAIVAYLEHPGLVLICRDKTFYQKVKNYQEYQGKENRQLKLGRAKEKRAPLKERLAAWFDENNRSRACEIYVWEEGEEIRLLITHGRPLRTDGSIDKQLRRSRVAYRPQKHDLVIYDNRLSLLKINAQTIGEKDLYRAAVGEILFGDLNHFPAGDIYTLEPLGRQSGLRPSAGIESVRLAEVWIEIDNIQHFIQVSKAHNLLESVRAYGRPNLEEGRLVRASFLIKYTSGGRPRKLELRPPNIAIYDRDRDGDAAENFMRVNGYLKIDAQANGA